MNTIDTYIGNWPLAMRMGKSEQNELKFKIIKESFIQHYENNPFFRVQCEQMNMSVNSLHGIESLNSIPLIPIRTFKQPNSHVLLSVPLDQIDLEMRSTGTSGIPSVTRRDITTTNRVGQSIFSLYRDFFKITHGVGAFLCPSTAEAPEMGMVKVLNLFNGILDEREYFVENYAFSAEKVVDYLRNWKDKFSRFIFGPPFLIYRLIRYMEHKDIYLQLDPKSFVVTIGGWKRFSGESISRQSFNQKLQERLGLKSSQIRDMYGLVESNMLAIECEHRQKHVPPWAYISVRDVTDISQELPVGSSGVLGILDGMSNSYPGYILTEDVGTVISDQQCECGRTGQIVKFSRRLHGAELGCCAVNIEKFIQEQEFQLSCETV